jgi:hypothetical protein
MRIPKVLMLCERKLGAFVLRMLSYTLKFDIVNRPEDKMKCVYAFWHRNLLLMLLHRIGSDACVVVSSSQDGELIAGPIEELGIKTARGSTTRQGSQAYRTILKMAKERQIGITPDGPRGPSKVIQQGVIHIAYMAKIPIIAVALDADKEWLFNSWDKFRFPKPFSKVTAIYGDPYYISSKDEIEVASDKLSGIFSNLEQHLLSNKKSRS